MNLFLFLPRKASQWFSFFISLIAASAVTFFLIAFICSFTQISVMFRIADTWDLRDSLFYTTNNDFSLSEEEKLAERNRILSTAGVLDANNVSLYYLTLPFKEKSFSITFINYSDSLLQDIRYELIEGSYPSRDQKNQILLPAYYREFYKVGDTLTGYDTAYSTLENTYEIPISVTVAGFFKEQPTFFPYIGGTALPLNAVFSRHTGVFEDGIEVTDGIAINFCDESGAVLPAKHTDMFLIRTNGSVPPEKVKENLSSVVESPCLLHTGNDMIDEYINASKEEIGETISLGITAVVLALSILVSSTVLELVYRKKEMATLYLCGASWSKCLRTVLATYILPFLIGFPIGLFLFAKSGEWYLFYILQPQLEIFDVLVTLGLETFFMACAILPFRFSTKFKTPYELFRKD